MQAAGYIWLKCQPGCRACSMHVAMAATVVTAVWPNDLRLRESQWQQIVACQALPGCSSSWNGSIVQLTVAAVLDVSA